MTDQGAGPPEPKLNQPTSNDAGIGQQRRSPAMVLAVVGFSVFVAADDLTVVSTMLRPIIADLGLVLPDGLDDAAWVVNAYLIAFVAVMPISGRISDILGRRRTFVGAYLLFLAGTILIPVSTELDSAFAWFLVGRILAAIGGGAMVPIALAVVGDVYQAEQRARAMGTLGAIETLGWVWGPLYGALLVRFLSWQWQFWLNVPIAILGIAACWWALADIDTLPRRARLDPLSAALSTVTLVALSLGLLGGAEIQSVSGFDELTGSRPNFSWMFAVAAVAGVGFVLRQRSTPEPLFHPSLFAGMNLKVTLVINFVVGAGLVVAMVDVPLFINSVELDLETAAVRSGWILSALTAAMAIASYLGGRITELSWARPPALAGVAMSAIAFLWMGQSWSPDTSYGLFALQLAILGAGFGLTVAPTTSTLVDAAADDQRGSAAALVMVVRLLGLSVGLSALTAWALRRFNDLRSQVELPPLDDPDFETSLLAAQETLTAQAIAETFTAAALAMGVGVVSAFGWRRMSASKASPVAAPPERVPIAAPAHQSEQRSDRQSSPQPTEQEQTAMRRTNWLVGALAAILVATLLMLALMASRVGDANRDAAEARAQIAITLERLDQTEAEVARVEAGAALYASQITGFQELAAELGPEVSAGIDTAVTGLRDFANSTIDFDVAIDQVVSIDTEVVIDRTVSVPVNTTIPFNQTFDTTISINTPLGPIPFDVTVPVDFDVPIDVVIDVPINETVPVNEDFPVNVEVPISIDVSQTELTELTESLATGLESLRQVLNGLTG